MSDRTDAEPGVSLAASVAAMAGPAGRAGGRRSSPPPPVRCCASSAATPPAARRDGGGRPHLIADRDAGEVFLADAGGAIIGMLAASWQIAIHIPGRYGLIQDLWVHRDWRSQAVGHGLVDALVGSWRQRQVTRIEVGVPRDGFGRHLEATRRFYLRNDFGTLGGRLRRELGDVSRAGDGDPTSPRRRRRRPLDRRRRPPDRRPRPRPPARRARRRPGRHARVRAIEADASDADVERVLGALHERDLPRRAARCPRRAGARAHAGFTRARAGARHPGRRRARRRRPRGRAHRDHRGRSASPTGRASPTRCADHPATTPARRGSAATAT